MRKYSHATVTAVVVANMVGTGVFTSLGFQLADIKSGFVLLLLWVVGGLAALCGALSYAELGAAFPRSGGEYNFLNRAFGPAAGFVSGWISATVGFTGPVALAAMTFAAYASASLPVLDNPAIQKAVAVGLILVLATIHSSSHRNSGGLQNGFTVLKIAVILLFCGAVFLFADPQPIRIMPATNDGSLIFSSAFAVSLIYVSYAYTGWNAATYLSGEFNDPQKYLPRILFGGTFIVMLLYVALNYTFLRAAPIDTMVNQIEVGAIAAETAFGDVAGRLTGAILAVLLISTVSAMTVAGPRVLQVVGEDLPALRVFAKTNHDGVPSIAIWSQSIFAILFIVFADFESIILFAGFTLALNSLAVVVALLYLRIAKPDLSRPFRVPLFPLTPLVYIALTGWTLIYVLKQNATEAIFGLAVIVVGLTVYLLSRVAGRYVKANRVSTS